jgi:tetratricopeptide (TPR) repeat protein
VVRIKLDNSGYVYAKSGFKEKALEIIEKFKQRAIDEPDSSFNIDFALLHSGMEDFDNAFNYLEKAVDERTGVVIFLRTGPGWSDLRSDPRFEEILKKAESSSFQISEGTSNCLLCHKISNKMLYLSDLLKIKV